MHIVPTPLAIVKNIRDNCSKVLDLVLKYLLAKHLHFRRSFPETKAAWDGARGVPYLNILSV